MMYEPGSLSVLHAETVKCHPGRSVSLTKRPSSGERLRSVENTNIIKSQESTLKDILSARILAVYPPGWGVR